MQIIYNLKVIAGVIIKPSETSRKIVYSAYLKESLFLLFLIELWETLKLNYFLPPHIRDVAAKANILIPSYNFKLFECFAGYIFAIIMLFLFAIILKYSVQILFRHKDRIKYISVFSFLCGAYLIMVIIGLIQIIISWIIHSYSYADTVYLILIALGGAWIFVLIAIFLKESHKLIWWKIVIAIIVSSFITKAIFAPIAAAISVFILRKV